MFRKVWRSCHPSLRCIHLFEGFLKQPGRFTRPTGNSLGTAWCNQEMFDVNGCFTPREAEGGAGDGARSNTSDRCGGGRGGGGGVLHIRRLIR